MGRNRIGIIAPASCPSDRKPAARRARRISGSLGAIVVICAILAPEFSRASPPTIFHSPGDDGIPAASVVSLALGVSESLHLYFSTGPQASVAGLPCVNGKGDEVCAVDVVVEGMGGSSFLGFTPSGDVVFALTPTRLRFNAGNPGTGGLGTVKLGDLVVDTSLAGTVELLQAQSVSADLELETVAPSQLLIVPEPAFAIGLLLGAALVGSLPRRRGSGCSRMGRGGRFLSTTPRASLF